jgi:methionine-rich copper-binding protein CopC
MLKLLKNKSALAATLALGLIATAPLYADAVMMHFALASSVPEADAMVSELDAIQLTFTQAPKEEGRTLRLLDPAGELVELGDVHMDEEKVMSAHVEAEGLGTGNYTVSWRAAGDDGHFTKGEYTFMLHAEDGIQ